MQHIFFFFLGNFVINGYSFLMPLQSEKKTNRINKKKYRLPFEK
jgi:hypothetical protein